MFNFEIEDNHIIAEIDSRRCLIDSIGGKEDARKWFAEQLGMSVEDVVFCQ